MHSSTNLNDWQNIGVFHDALLAYPDLRTNGASTFYRVQAAPRAPSDDWKNQVRHFDDPFREPVRGPNDLEWIKFSILLNDPTRVYYQDSAVFPFHYEFATQRLPPFQGMTRPAFDSISLFRTNQQVVLGAILMAPPGLVEYGIQFVGLEAFSPEEVARWFSLVKATVYSPGGSGVFYVPTFEQSETARTNKAAFDRLGVPVTSVERWIPGNHCYAVGWALGRLKFFSAAEISIAYADGRLRPEDILLTDGVPAETPLVAGIISLRPSTPNSHTAILARSFGIPFVYFSDSEEQKKLQMLAGRQVILRAVASPGGRSDLAFFDVEGSLTPELQEQLLALKRIAPINYTPKEALGSFSRPTDALTPADIRFFGGKAANYGFLRRHVPTNAPPAIAFSFDLWDDFMSQVRPGQTQTLRQEISALLAPYTNFPPNMIALKQTLATVRSLITQSADFNAAQRQAITNALVVFDPHRKIRFRSSTNVEDSESFTGAGLYDSYSGCLLDDLDPDNAGPSHCDPTETQERGVFRAMRRVYASFYNDNAFLERLRHGVDEAEVAMGVLVHHSFPDEDELANGVATLTWNDSFGTQQFTGDLVTQKGAVSVTNPDGSSLPEVVNLQSFGSSRFLTLTRYSSLLPLGARVLAWESEYLRFADLFDAIAQGFREYYAGKPRFTLDFEYKKDRYLGLVVKQVRQIPEPASGRPAQAFLVNQPSELVVAQGERGDVFANHRLKSVRNLQTRSMWLANSNLADGIYADGRLEFLEDTNRLQLSGALATWPEAAHSADGSTNEWKTGPATNVRKWQLVTAIQTNAPGGDPPIFGQEDFQRQVYVTYSKPVPRIEGFGTPDTTLSEGVLLEPKRSGSAGTIFAERSFNTNGIKITTSFRWPLPPRGPTAGYTAPLVRFEQTRITGLTSTPITLTNYYSQTYRPGHHNFVEEFVFEPRLEPGLPDSARAELEAANIRMIYLRIGFSDAILVLGADDKFRPL